MRTINYIVLHCTATGRDVTPLSIQKYWKNELKWTRPGYHYLVLADGDLATLHPENYPSNGVAGFNAHSLHVAYTGGVDLKGNPTDNRTPEQKKTLLELLVGLKKKYPFSIIQGHRDFPGVKKACPCFDAIKEYEGL